jgi:hypothetical protein
MPLPKANTAVQPNAYPGTQTAKAKPKVRHQPRYQPGPVTDESVCALLDYYEGFLAVVSAIGMALDPHADLAPLPPTNELLKGLPQGPFQSAYIDYFRGSYLIRFRMLGSKEEHRIVPVGFLLLRVLCLFDDGPFDVRHRGRLDAPGIPILADGFTFFRLMANADEDEAVRRNPHNDLLPWSLSLQPGRPRALRERKDAINKALRLYEKNAKEWGLAGILSSQKYSEMLKGAFRLFDWRCGWHFLQPIAPEMVTETAER